MRHGTPIYRTHTLTVPAMGEQAELVGCLEQLLRLYPKADHDALAAWFAMRRGFRLAERS